MSDDNTSVTTTTNPTAGDDSGTTTVKRTRNRQGPTRDAAKALYASTNSRKEFITEAVAQGIKATTASTYYANLKNGVWA